MGQKSLQSCLLVPLHCSQDGQLLVGLDSLGQTPYRRRQGGHRDRSGTAPIDHRGQLHNTFRREIGQGTVIARVDDVHLTLVTMYSADDGHGYGGIMGPAPLLQQPGFVPQVGVSVELQQAGFDLLDYLSPGFLRPALLGHHPIVVIVIGQVVTGEHPQRLEKLRGKGYSPALARAMAPSSTRSKTSSPSNLTPRIQLRWFSPT